MKEIFRLCFVLTIIAAVSAGVLAFVDQKTQEPIANSLREEKMAAVRNVLPEFDNEPDKDTIILEVPGVDSVTFYRGKMGADYVGVAFSVIAPNGYSGEIEIMGRRFTLAWDEVAGTMRLVGTARRSEVVYGDGFVVDGETYTVRQQGDTAGFVVYDERVVDQVVP